MKTPNFDTTVDHSKLNEVRAAIRDFLRNDPASSKPHADSWSCFDAAFSGRLGRAGFIGMTWPKQYGGGERSSLERYVVVEELLAAGAPAAAHWIADRQTGPQLLKFGTDDQKQTLLPAIARGECFCSIGMSEPDSGSDLASVRTRAVRAGDKCLFSRARQDGHTDLFIFFNRGERSAQLRHHRHIQRVQLLRPIDGDVGDLVLGFEFKILIGHLPCSERCEESLYT